MPDLNKKNWLHKKNWGVALLCSTLAFSSAIAEENIAISSLDEVSVDTIGTLVLGGGGLNATLWQGTSRNDAELYLATLPKHMSSPLLSALQNSLILSTVTPPEGTGKYENLTDLRLSALYQNGNYKAFSSFYDVIPEKDITESMALKNVVYTLSNAASPRVEACASIESNDAFHKNKNLRLAKAFCQAVQGDKDKSLLTLSLLQEDYPELPYHVTQLIERIAAKQQDTSGSVMLPSPLTPLDLLMISEANIPLPEGLDITSYPVFMLRALALYKGTPKSLRMLAAEESLLAESISPDSLKAIYNSIEFPEEILSSSTISELKLPPELLRPLLYQKIERSEDAVLFQAMHVMLEQYHKDGLTDVAYALLRTKLPDATALEKADSAVLAFAPEAIKMLLSSNSMHSVSELEITAARSWYNLLKTQTLSSARNTKTLAYQAFLIEIAKLGEDPKIAEENSLPWQKLYEDEVPALSEWWVSQVENGRIPQNITDPAVLSSMILLTEALGYHVPESEQQRYSRLIAKKSRISAKKITEAQEILFHALPSDVDENHPMAKVIYHLLKAFEHTDISDSNPVVIAAAIRQLRSVGLYDEAKALALAYL